MTASTAAKSSNLTWCCKLFSEFGVSFILAWVSRSILWRTKGSHERPALQWVKCRRVWQDSQRRLMQPFRRNSTMSCLPGDLRTFWDPLGRRGAKHAPGMGTIISGTCRITQWSGSAHPGLSTSTPSWIMRGDSKVRTLTVVIQLRHADIIEAEFRRMLLW
jgi:hypothetical protein